MTLPKESAAVFFTGKEQAELRSIPLHEPGEGEILVKTTKTLISTGTETIIYGGRYDVTSKWEKGKKYPSKVGYSHAGVVVASGKNCKIFKEGDHVASSNHHQQYVVAAETDPSSGFRPIPAGVSDQDATWSILARIVQLGIRRAEHDLGETVVIVGLGPLGQLAVQYVHLLGPRELIVLDPVQSRMEMAKKHGATHALAVSVDDALDAVKEITNGRMANAVYDMTGNEKVFASAQGLLRVLGKLVLIGDTGFPSGQHLTDAVIGRCLQIIGSMGPQAPVESNNWYYWSRANMVDLFFHYLKDGRMCVSDLNTHSFSPSNPQAAYQKLLHDRANTMGCHFDWTEL